MMFLKIARKIAGLSQSRLAQLAGVDIAAVSRFESGERDIRKAGYKTVVRLATVFHLEPDELLAFAAAMPARRAPARPPARPASPATAHLSR